MEYILKNDFVTTLYFSKTNDGFESFSIINNDTKVEQVIPFNFLNNQTIGLNQSVSLTPLKWLNLNFFADVSYSDTKSTVPTTLQYLSGWNGYFSINNSVRLSQKKDFMLSFSYNYVTKGVDNLDENTSSNQLNIGLKKLFFDKKMTVSLYASDIFRSNSTKYTTYSNGIKNSFKNYYDERFLRLSVVYRFGKKIQRNNRNNKNTEEIQRAN